MDQHSLEDLISDASFVRWIRGESSPGEDAAWNRWLREDPRHKYLAEEAKSLLTAFQKEKEAKEAFNTSRELARLEQQLDWDSGKINEMSVFPQKLKPKKKKTWYDHSRIIAVAAVFAVVALTGLYAIYQYQLVYNTEGEDYQAEQTNVQEYKTDFGEKATFRLSDDSRVVLNANSHIRFLSGIDKGKSITEVWLEGEAWFDITHFEDERRRTFTVHTVDGSVEVLGTRFAVKTFENETRTVLEEGEIRVQVTRQTDRSSQTGSKDSTILEPGEMVLYSSGKAEVTVEQVNPLVYTSWSEDIWFFEDTPLHEIGQRIEDTFGIEVKIKENLTHRKLSGSIKGTSIDVLAEALARILDVEVEKQDQVLHIE